MLITSLVAAAPVEQVSQLQVVVWSDAGTLLTDADIVARDASGEYVKLEALPNGTYLLPAVGPKTEVQISHAALGDFAADLPLLLDAGRVRIDVVYTGHGAAEVFSPNLLPPLPQDPGDGGVPANDLCANATPIGLGTTAGTTIGATFDNAGTCVTSNTSPGVWYTVVGTGTPMTATTCSAAVQYDTKLSVFCGSCDSLTCITGNDDSCTGGSSSLLSTVTWCSQAGATYRILVHGFQTATGNFSLTVSAGTAPCTPTVNCIPPVPTGACCYSDGSCEIVTRVDCLATGGTYQGDDTGCFVPGTPVVYNGTANQPIPDGLGTGIPGGATTHTINVPTGGIIADVDIDLSVNHTWVGDLIVTVTHGGTSVTVVDRPGVPLAPFGCAEDNYVGIILDDEGGGGSIETQCAPNLTSPPNYTPANPLSAFDGMDAAGPWIISVTDNAAADVGTLVSWSVHVTTAAGPICPQPECHLVIGSGPGNGGFFGSWHNFTTQVANVQESHPVLLNSIPKFLLPNPQTTGRITAPTPGGLGLASFGTSSAAVPEAGSVPSWMAGGQFAVQVVMWNPQVFPYLPEQYTAGLHVYLMADGTVRTVPFGNNLGGLTVTHQITTNAAGQKFIKFPFTIPGF